MVAIIFDRNADSDLSPLKIFRGQNLSFFHFWLAKFKPQVFKIETLLKSQNLTKDRELLLVCSEVQKYGVVKTHLGIVTPQIDPPDFLPILTKFSKNCH